VTGDNPIAHANLAMTWEREGDLAKARYHYQEMLKLDTVPARRLHADTHHRLALIAERLGDAAEVAEQHYRAALQRDPLVAGYHNNFGAWLERQGRLDEAVEQFQIAVRLRPSYALAHHNLASALLTRGSLPQALTHLEEAKRLEPRDAEIHHSLGVAHGRQRDWSRAIDGFRRAVELRPEEVRFRFGLAYAHQGGGDLASARTLYRDALARDAGGEWRQQAQRDAWQLATAAEAGQRDGRLALELALRLCQATDFQDPVYLDTLAAAQAEGGDFPAAARTAEQALALATAQKRQPLVEALQGRLRLYRDNRPNRQSS
jgi:Tfp pilus assembly protein PilF